MFRREYSGHYSMVESGPFQVELARTGQSHINKLEGSVPFIITNGLRSRLFDCVYHF